MDLGAFHRARASCFVCILGLSQSNLSCVHLGAFAEQANSNAFPLGVFLSCVHLGAFRGANNFKSRSSSRFLFCMHLRAFSIAFQRLSSSRFPILCASCGLSQNKRSQTSFLFEASHVACILRPFTTQSSSNAFLCVHLGAFHRASKFRLQMPFLFEVSCLVCILRPFAERANSNALPLRSSPFCVHHGAFRRASKFKRLSSSLLQSKQEFKRLSSSRFPTLCASWGVSPSREYQTSFLGLSQSKQLQTSFLFEVYYFACILGPFAGFPLRGFLSCVHLGAFRKASKFKRPSSSKIPMLCAS